MSLQTIGLGNVAIIGLGKSGTAAARFCLRHLVPSKTAANQGVIVDSMTIYAGKATEATKLAAREFVDAGIEVVFDTEEVVGGFDLAIVSPGISVNSGFYASAKAAATQIISEPELAFRLSGENWVGITGTNGKTTTTMLVSHILNECSIPSRTVGNIGDPCIDAIEDRIEGEVFAAELSSYQLTSMPTFKPSVGILLNITPDHLSWHGIHECYMQAKYSMFANMDASGFSIVDCADGDNLAFAKELASRSVRVIALGGPSGIFEACGSRAWGGCGDAYVDGNALVVTMDDERFEICESNELSIKGEHNLQNALAACAAALALGANIESVSGAVKTFSPVEHRIEPCGKLGGISFFNDSKATNVDAVLKALTAFRAEDGLAILLGGRDKGTDLDELVEQCFAKCKAIICYGEAKERFFEAFSSQANGEGDLARLAMVDGMIDALDEAIERCEGMGTVLLSPACASFDEFDSFEHRGEVFKELVGQRISNECEQVR